MARSGRTKDGNDDEQARLAADNARLHAANTDLHTQIALLRAELQGLRPTVDAAEQLAAEAETARLAAEDALRQAHEEYEALQATIDERVKLAMAGNARAKDRREIGRLRTLLAHMEERVHDAEAVQARVHSMGAGLMDVLARIERMGTLAVLDELCALRDKVKAGELEKLGCGCKQMRVDTSECTHGGKHPIMSLSVINNDIGGVVSQLMARAMPRDQQADD